MARTSKQGFRWVFRRIGAGLLVLVAVLLVLLLFALTSLFHSETSATRLAHFVLDRVVLYTGARLEVDRLRVARSGRIEIRRVRLEDGQDPPIASIDMIAAQVRMSDLWGRRIVVDSLRVTNPRIDLPRLLAGMQAAKQGKPKPEKEPAQGDEQPSRLAVEIGAFRLERGALDVARSTEAPRLQIRDLEIRGALRTLPSLEAVLDTLGAQVGVSGTSDPARLWARGRLAQDVVQLDTLRLDGAGTRLGARAKAPILRGLEPLLAQLDVDLDADPFDARIVQPFVTLPDSGAEIRAALHAHTQGTSYADLRGNIDLEVNVAQWGRRVITAVRLDARSTESGATFALRIDDPALPILIEGKAQPNETPIPFDLTATHPAGRLALRGGVAPRDGPALRITHGRVDDLDLQRLSSGLPATDLAAQFTVESRGRDPRTMQLDTEIDVLPGSIGELTLDEVHVVAKMESGRLELRTQAEANGARLSIDANAVPFVLPRTGRVQIDFDQVDLAQLAGGAPRSDLSGRLEADVSWRDSTDRRAVCTLALRPSTCGTETISHGELRTTLDRNAVEVAGTIGLSKGDVRLDATARPFEAVRELELRSLRFTGLDVGALLGKPALRSQLEGRASGQVSLAAGRSPSWQGDLDLAPSTFASARIERVTLEGRQRGEALDASAEIRLPGAGCTFEAHGKIGGPGTRLEARGVVRSEDLSRALGRGPAATIGLDFEAEGTALASKSRGGTLVLDGQARAGDLQVDSIHTRIVLAGDRVEVATLGVHSNALVLTGGGTLALPDLLPPAGDSLAVSAVVGDPSSLAALLGRRRLAIGQGSLSAVLHAAGSPAPFVATLQLDSVRVDDASVEHVVLGARGALLPKLRVDSLTAFVAAETLHAGRFAVRSVRADVALDTVGVDLRARTVLDDSTTLALAVRGVPRSQGRAVLDSLNSVFGADRWSLVRPATIDYGRRISVDEFHWRSGEQAIRAAGTFDPDAEHALTVEIDSVRLEPYTVRLGYPAYGGLLDANARLTGSAAAPQLDGKTTIRITRDDDQVGLGGSFAGSASGLEVTAFLTAGDDSLHVRGRAPIALPRPLGPADPKSLSAAPLTAEIHAAQFDVAPLAMLAPRSGISQLEGVLDVDARVDGSVAAPRFEGQAALAKGVVQLETLGALWEDITLQVALADDNLKLQNLAAKSGKGSLTASGGISFARESTRELELHAKLDRFRAPWNRSMQIQTTGTLDVTGTPTAPVVKGKLAIAKSNLDVTTTTGSAAEVQLSEADLRMLEERFGYRVQKQKPKGDPPFVAAAIDVDLEIQPDTWVRRRANPRLAIEMRGNLQLRKQPQEKLRVEGEIKAVPARSYVEQFGRRFEIETGTVRFDGDPADGRVDLVGKHEVRMGRDRSADPDVTITVAVRGGFDSPKLVLSSDPAMEEGDIVATLLTGRPPAGTVATSTGDEATSAASAMVASQATGAVEELGSGIGLDVLQVEIDGVRGATVVAGRYVNPKTYLGVRQSATFQEAESEDPNSNAGTDVEVEYEFLEWLLFNFQGGVTDLRAMFRSRYEY